MNRPICKGGQSHTAEEIETCRDPECNEPVMGLAAVCEKHFDEVAAGHVRFCEQLGPVHGVQAELEMMSEKAKLRDWRPPIQGGQGRSAQSISDSGWFLAVLVLLLLGSAILGGLMS